MTPGLAFFYGGLVSEGAVINTMMLSFGSMGVVTVLWALIGYSMAFGPVSIMPNVLSTWDVSKSAPFATKETAVIGNAQLGLFTFMDQLRQGGWVDANNMATTWTTPGATPVYLNITEHTFSMFQLMRVAPPQTSPRSRARAPSAERRLTAPKSARPLPRRCPAARARNRFAIVTVAIISGAVVGKIKYAWFMAFAALWHLLIYCPLAHWIFFYDG